MNAAFLLVTTAWFAGQAPAAAPAPAPAPNACCASSCNTCDSCEKPRFCDRLKAMFRKKDDCCAPTCAAPTCAAPTCAAPTCATTCDTGCCEKQKHKLFQRKESCNECDPCAKPSLMDRIRAMCHKDKGCCDTCSTGCANGSCGGGTTVMPKAGETIPTPPKKMPSTGKEPPPAKQVQLDTPSTLSPATPAIITPPAVQQQRPAIVPSVDADNLRNPF